MGGVDLLELLKEAAPVMLTGAGYTLKVPAIDLAEVGAGGGSHVWIDGGGALQAGPESAGASPGPVCYDQGGEVPTISWFGVTSPTGWCEAGAGGGVAPHTPASGSMPSMPMP